MELGPIFLYPRYRECQLKTLVYGTPRGEAGSRQLFALHYNFAELVAKPLWSWEPAVGSAVYQGVFPTAEVAESFSWVLPPLESHSAAWTLEGSLEELARALRRGLRRSRAKATNPYDELHELCLAFPKHLPLS